jgi:hypothetical protein
MSGHSLVPQDLSSMHEDGNALKWQIPQQFIETHSITRELGSLGVTDDHLQAMRFRRTNDDLPFDLWPFEFPTDLPREARPLVKSYCTLKWLILEHPPYSRNRDDAYRLRSETIVAPIFNIGMKAKIAQRDRAKKPRGKITSYGETLGHLIETLALQRQYRADTARELWPHFFCRFDGAGPLSRRNRRKLMLMWRFAVITFLREALNAGVLASNLHPSNLKAVLAREYRWWSTHVDYFQSKEHFLRYAGRYARRPPIAQHRLKRSLIPSSGSR